MRFLIIASFVGAALLSVGPCSGQTVAQGLPVRANPAEYQAAVKAGALTIAADFDEHSVTTQDGVYGTEDFVVVELAVFGAPGTKVALQPGEFSLRINGKKAPVAAAPAPLVFHSLKDPEWETSVALPKSATASKTSIGGGGGGGNDPPPAAPKMPIETERKMQQHVQKASLPEGERPVPVAGLLFFPYRGKGKSISSLELVYAGSAGKATLTLQ